MYRDGYLSMSRYESLSRDTSRSYCCHFVHFQRTASRHKKKQLRRSARFAPTEPFFVLHERIGKRNTTLCGGPGNLRFLLRRADRVLLLPAFVGPAESPTHFSLHPRGEALFNKWGSSIDWGTLEQKEALHHPAAQVCSADASNQAFLATCYVFSPIASRLMGRTPGTHVLALCVYN